MPGLSDLLGRNGVIEQLLLWQVVGQVVANLGGPGFTALAQDVAARHPELALSAEQAADLAAHFMLDLGEAKAEAARNGIDARRFGYLADRAKVRIPPADLATAVLRSYMTLPAAEAEAKPQGITAEQLAVLRNLAGDAPGPDQLAVGVRRGLIDIEGRGPAATSFQQGIAESRLHDKWGRLILDLAVQLLSAPDAASAVVRNFLARDDAQAIAAENGVDAATFAVMVHLAADAPGPQQLAEALRRGLIDREGRGPDSTSFQQGIAEGRLADKWAHVIEGLAKLWPTPVDAINALVKGQIPADEGKALYERLGGDKQFYDWLLHSAGEGPTPLEAAEAASRGYIPWNGTGPEVTSYEQAVKESRYRDKWSKFYRQLHHYLPPPSEIITFLAHTAITKERATQLLDLQDLDPDILAAFLNEAELTNLSDYRGLTQSAVVDMFYAHMIDDATATELLGLLHVTPEAARLLLAYADLRQVIDSIQRSVQRIAQLYTGRKISTQTAQAALVRLEIPSGSVDQIIATWELQAAANVKTLSESQIVDAWYYLVLSQAEAIEALGAIGWTPYDAWVLLSNKAKGPLPNRPARIVAPPPGAVIPGVT